MPYFCRSGHPVLTVDQFFYFADPFLPHELVPLWLKLFGEVLGRF